jgi:hypothetical protein
MQDEFDDEPDEEVAGKSIVATAFLWGFGVWLGASVAAAFTGALGLLTYWWLVD